MNKLTKLQKIMQDMADKVEQRRAELEEEQRREEFDEVLQSFADTYRFMDEFSKPSEYYVVSKVETRKITWETYYDDNIYKAVSESYGIPQEILEK